MKKNFTLVLAMMFALSLLAFGGGENRAGTSSAPELTIPVGARYLGTVGSGVAVASGLEAIYWNPAGVDNALRDVNAMFSYRDYIADINVNFASVSSRFSFGTLAISLRAFEIGEIKVTTESAPDGTGEILEPTFFVIGGTYSVGLSDRTSVGVTVNAIQESFGRVNASGVSFDLGVQYRDLIGIQGLTTGVVVKNLGPGLNYEGSGLFRQADVPGSDRESGFFKVSSATFDLPTVFELGLAYAYPIGDENSLMVTGAYQNNNFAVDEYRFGVEYSYDQMLYLRGGYLFSTDPIQGADVATDHVFENFTLGFGVNFANVGELEIDLNYAYVPAELFNDNHIVGINVGF
jgi:hypothetical protein